jgi:hypothetical protein
MFENRALLSVLSSLLSFARKNQEMLMPLAFQQRIPDFPAGNLSNSLYFSLLAGNSDSLRVQDPSIVVRRFVECNFLNQNVSVIAFRHSPHVWRRARRSHRDIKPKYDLGLTI